MKTKELTREEKLKVLQYLEDMPYIGDILCLHIQNVIKDLYPEYDDNETCIDELFPEADDIIEREGNKKAGHKRWIGYGNFIKDNEELLAFRKEILKKIINLKNEL